MMDKAKCSSRLTGVRTALAKIIQLHHDFPAVLRELGDIEHTQSKEENSLDKGDVENARKKHCVDKDLDNKFISKDYCGMTESLVIEQLEKEAASLNVEVSVAATSLVKAQIKNIIGTSKDDSNYNRDIKGLCHLVKILNQQSLIQGSSLGEQLLQEPAFICLPLRVLWWFHQAKITSFELILRSIYESGRTSCSVSTELFCIIKYDDQTSQIENFPKTLDDYDEDDEVSKSLQDIIGAVVALAYDLEDREEYVGLRKYAGNILTSITSKVMDFILEEEMNYATKRKSDQKSSIISGKRAHGNDSGESDPSYPSILNWYGLILETSSISNSALEKYLSSQLIQILTHRPEIGLGRVLREQEKWRSTMASHTLSGLLRRLVVGVGHKSALDTLELVVTNDEVNWGAVLTLVATALNCHQDTAITLKHMIEQYIQRGCRDQEMESLVIGFLFARHACQEGRHIFPPYAQWFLSLFAAESTSPANTKPTFVFLVKFLTDLVPHEPAYCLRAHISNQIFIPRGCQDIIRDYCYLARSRLRDLSETFEPNSKFSQNAFERNKVVEEVENAITSFGETGKIPKKIIEASIFRKPYFRSSLLPVLLTPRPLPDVPDDKLKLIESLHASGKIPVAMYKNYFVLCQKEASDLLSGVFTDVQEEIVVDEPINELEAIINELVKHGERSSNMNEILPIFSRVSSKLEEILKFMDARVKDSTFITIDIRLYNEKGMPYIICEKFFHLVELICYKKYDPGTKKKLKSKLCHNKNRPSWLGQFLGLLASSITLQGAFFTLLMHSLKQGQEGNLSADQINLYALILCELHNIDGLFLPVVSSTSPENSPQNFLNFFIKYLLCNSHQAIEFTTILTSSWISWHIFTNENIFESDDKETESLDGLFTNIINLYVCLAPRFAVMGEVNGINETKAEYKPNESLEENESFMIDVVDISGSEMSLADVYNRLSGLDVPLASQLYYTDEFKKLQQYYQVSLDDWIRFELQATWAKTQLSVRQTYLQCRLKQEFLDKHSNNQSSNKKSKKRINKSTSGKILTMIKDIISVLIDGGMNKMGVGEVIILLQSLLLQSVDCGVFLLEEWIRITISTEKSIGQSSTSQRIHRSKDELLLSFMSLCRCLPSSLFLNPDKLLESVGALQTLLENLRSANTSSFMNLTDTSYFCSVLLGTACNNNTKSPQLQHFLLSFKQDICFHWDSLQKMFAWEAPKVSKQKCIEDLVSSLSSNNYMSLEASCVSARSVSLILSSSEVVISDTCSGPMMLSTMLLYIAQQQLRGRIPMFLTEHTQLSTEDERILSLCSTEMLKQLRKKNSITIILQEVLPTKNENRIVHKTVPCAATNIILCLQKSKGVKDSNTSEVHTRMLEMLLICHELVSFWFENSSVCQATNTEVQLEATVKTNSKLSRLSHSPSKLSRKSSSSSNVANTHSLSYIVQLTQLIYSVISKMPLNVFSDLSKNILQNTDSEIKASIQRRVNLKSF